MTLDDAVALVLRHAAAAGATAALLVTDRIPGAWAVPRAATDDPFTLGVASGDPTLTGVVLWTRLAPQPLDPDGGMPARGWVGAVAAASVRLGAASAPRWLRVRPWHSGSAHVLPDPLNIDNLADGCDNGADPTVRSTACPKATAEHR